MKTIAATIRPVTYSPAHLGAAFRVEIYVDGANTAGSTVATLGAAKRWAKRFGGAGVQITMVK